MNRDLLWKVLSNFCRTPHFLTILQVEFHDGMTTMAIITGQEFDPFEVLAGDTGVKQLGCVLGF